MSEEKFNEQVVGTYYAICQHTGCGAKVAIPVRAHQASLFDTVEGEIVTQPDLTEALEHFYYVHNGEWT